MQTVAGPKGATRLDIRDGRLLTVACVVPGYSQSRVHTIAELREAHQAGYERREATHSRVWRLLRGRGKRTRLEFLPGFSWTRWSAGQVMTGALCPVRRPAPCSRGRGRGRLVVAGGRLQPSLCLLVPRLVVLVMRRGAAVVPTRLVLASVTSNPGRAVVPGRGDGATDVSAPILTIYCEVLL